MPITQISIDDVVVSPLNPRKLDLAHVSPEDAQAINELTQSIITHGVLEPCIGRRDAKGRVELLVGQRRFLAAKKAQLEKLPVDVRTLDDAEAVRIALTEQLQREDLHPLDEAAAYEKILDGIDLTVGGALAELAASIGKSTSYVRKRLALTSLTRKAEEAFRRGDIDLGRAFALARIPSAKVQDQVLAKALERDNRGDVAGPLELRAMIMDDHMRDLREAPFDLEDAQLVKEAGSCGTCPKNTAQAPELFDDATGAGICTDEECYGAKCAAAFDVRARDLLAKKKITKALDAKQASKLFHDDGRMKYGTGKVDLDDKHWDPSSGSEKKWRTLLKGELDSGAIRPELVMRPDGTAAELVSDKAAHGVAEKLRRAKTQATKPKADAKAREKNRAAKREAEVLREVAVALRNACVEAAGSKGEAITLRLAVAHGNAFQLEDEDVARISPTLAHPEDLEDKVGKLSVVELRKAVMMLALAEHTSLMGNELRDELLDAAKLLGVDVKKVEREVRAVLAAKVDAPAPAKGKPGKGGKSRAA